MFILIKKTLVSHFIFFASFHQEFLESTFGNKYKLFVLQETVPRLQDILYSENSLFYFMEVRTYLFLHLTSYGSVEMLNFNMNQHNITSWFRIIFYEELLRLLFKYFLFSFYLHCQFLDREKYREILEFWLMAESFEQNILEKLSKGTYDVTESVEDAMSLYEK